MKYGRVRGSSGLKVIGEQVALPVDQRARRLHSCRDIDFNADHFRWATNDRDWNDVFRDALNFFNKPLNLVKRWFC
jgi:hypothetical protein